MVSYKFNHVFIKDWYSIATPKETLGAVKKYNQIIPDNYFGEKTYERAEAKMQRVVIDNLLKRNDLQTKLDLIIGGELANQLAILNMTMSKYPYSYLGVYSACASFNESLIILGNLIDSKKIKNGLCLTSSHTEVAERQFRYPIEYGSPRLKRSTMTATGSSGVILSTDGKIMVTKATIGSSVNYGISDANNMGAVMAPAAAKTLMAHLKNFKETPDIYDLILTGDLGRIGSQLFLEILKKNNIKLTNYYDAGSLLFQEKDFNNAGSSGPVSLPLVLFNKIIPSKKYKKILLLATGALHSPTLVNQHEEIPSICHAVSLEVL